MRDFIKYRILLMMDISRSIRPAASVGKRSPHRIATEEPYFAILKKDPRVFKLSKIKSPDAKQ